LQRINRSGGRIRRRIDQPVARIGLDKVAMRTIRLTTCRAPVKAPRTSSSTWCSQPPEPSSAAHRTLPGHRTSPSTWFIYCRADAVLASDLVDQHAGVGLLQNLTIWCFENLDLHMKNLLPIRPNNAEVLFLNVAHRGNLTGEIIAKKAEAVECEYLQPLQILADISSPFASRSFVKS
jgi:hypothetical protein